MFKKLKFLLWVFYIVIIILLALLPDTPKVIDWQIEKPWIIRHIATFAVFVPLTYLTFPRWRLGWIVATAMLFGLLVELFQLWFTHGSREFALSDLGYDAVGIVVGVVLVLVWKKVEGTRD